jgi:hypothetical protein
VNFKLNEIGQLKEIHFISGFAERYGTFAVPIKQLIDDFVTGRENVPFITMLLIILSI